MTTTPATRPSFVTRYSIALFFILAMVLGSGVVFLVIRGILPSNLALASVLSASTAGIIMTAVEDGRAGLKLLLSRLFVWRVGIGYWLFALLFLVPAFLIGSMGNPLSGGDPFSLSDQNPTLPLMPTFILFFIISGLGQELGWTGFLTPRLQSRFSALTSSVIRAVLVSIWHLPLLIFCLRDPPALADFPYGGWIAQHGFLITFGASLALFQLPWSIFFTWLFNNSRGSVLLVAVLHGSEIWTAYWMLRAGIDPRNLDNYWGYGAILVVTAILIVIMSGSQHLSRKHSRVVHR